MRFEIRERSSLVASLPSIVVVVALTASALLPSALLAQRSEGKPIEITSETFSALTLREIGPALMGGRVADIAVDPHDSSRWFLAIGSGGVWKTENAGVTWTPVFDDQPSYSIGCVTIDPGNSDVVWVGTGENVSGRHVGWGDGIYKSIDGGQSWQAMGLEHSEHLSEIVVDPRDSDVVYVAAEGPLWSSGGERGLYKTTDGGATWTASLTIDEDTGVTDIEIDPRNPDVLYAAAYQRRRHVWSLLAGGPGSGIYKSTDAGASWRKIERGLPSGDVGKIGLAISPADPNVVYATIEAQEDERGFYRSSDRGESWKKRDSYISNGTGPHYYQEIVASPHDVDHVYQMDVFLHVTRDGGNNFEIVGNGREKHSDNHALWIDPNDSEHLLAGTDGGLYESFDDGVRWRQFPNLPVSQFYKLALDSSEPFYNILGGAQDLGTLLGPSRTATTDGVRNRDWIIPLGADGYACAFDPENPDIMYLEWQVGNLNRYDHQSGEVLDIRPVPAAGDEAERFNWDAPLMISPHSSTRLYFGSQRLWRSDDRGDSWTAISDDLTTGTNRYEQEMAGRVWSVDALYDNGAMSQYATTTAISESPLVEGLLYVGTDDGNVQVSEDGGASWRAAAEFPRVPDWSFINDIKASHFSEDSVYVVVDAHKLGDYRPLIFRSNDRGESWESISGGLADTEIVWGIEQDHEVEELLFAATERGLRVTLDGGKQWLELAGAPTIAFRDLEIQRRDDDLVGASFGRGFYVLDDYSPLRQIAQDALDAQDTVDDGAFLFDVRDGWWYVPFEPMQAKGQPSQGSSAYAADNPPFGVVFTVYLDTAPQTAEQTRGEREKKLREADADVPFPGWETLRQESLEEEPQFKLTVRNSSGEAVRTLYRKAEAGLHRLSWDLRYPAPNAIRLEQPSFRPPWAGDPRGPLVPPGNYSVELELGDTDGNWSSVGEPRSFELKPVPGTALPTPNYAEVATFQNQTRELYRRVVIASNQLDEMNDRLDFLRAAFEQTPGAPGALAARIEQFEEVVAELRLRVDGDRIRGRRDVSSAPSIFRRIGQVAGGHWDTRQAPTRTQRDSLAIAASELETAAPEIKTLREETLPAIEAELERLGAPYTPHRGQ